jgi:hypothetical protein
MKWNGCLGLMVASALVVAFSPAARAEVNRYTTDGATESVVVVNPAAESHPVTINTAAAAEFAATNATNATGAMLGGYGGHGGYGAYGGSHGFGPGYVPGYGIDYSGWNNCNCSPPCTAHLWQGYVQTPRRCYPGKHGGHCGQCGNGGSYGNGGCEACGNGSMGYGSAGYAGGYGPRPGAAVNVYAQTWLNANNGYCNSCNKASFYDRIYGNSNPFPYTPTPAATSMARPPVQAAPVAATMPANTVAPISLPTLQSSKQAIGSGLK